MRRPALPLMLSLSLGENGVLIRARRSRALAGHFLGNIVHAASAFALFLAAQSALAANCPVLHDPPPTDADKALLAADYAKAESLYRTALAASPGDVHLTTGLVLALLRDQKLQDAADTVNTALEAAPNSPPLIALRAEVELRAGEPWTAAQSVVQSLNLDPCYPRAHLIYSNILDLNSLYATGRAQLLMAHQLDPDDPDIRGSWMMTLPIKQRIPEIEDYLSAPRGDDADGIKHLKQYLEHLLRLADQPRKPCRLVSQTTSTQIHIETLMRDATRMEGYGLYIKLNNHQTRLEIDTGAGGIVISRDAAKRAGLKAFSENAVGGLGDDGEKKGYTAYADSIRIGELEFQNCAVQVTDNPGPADIDGLIGMDVLSRFLVTLDYPGHKLLLDPLPPRPDDQPGASNKLNTGENQDSDEDSPAQSAQNAPAAAENAPQKPAANGPRDRYIAPEMSDYTKVLREGHDLIIPTQINGSKVKLFILDTGSFATIISPQAARDVTKVRGDSSMIVKGVSGEVKKLYKADRITFNFAHLSQQVQDVVSLDMTRISKDEGMEISGFLGATTLFELTIHIDYRDGLVKFDYDPRRVSTF